jgi:hypothetical protein
MKNGRLATMSCSTACRAGTRRGRGGRGSIPEAVAGSSRPPFVARPSDRRPALEAADVGLRRRVRPDPVAGGEEPRHQDLDELGVEDHHVVGRLLAIGVVVGEELAPGTDPPPLPESPLEQDEGPSGAPGTRPW